MSHSCCTMVNPDGGASDFVHGAPGSDHSEKENQSLVKVIRTQTAGVSCSFTVTSETSKVTLVLFIHIKQYNSE